MAIYLTENDSDCGIICSFVSVYLFRLVVSSFKSYIPHQSKYLSLKS